MIRGKKAFTIAEILIVMVILVTIGYGVAILFKQVMMTYNKVRALNEMSNTSRNVFYTMANDLENAYISQSDSRFCFMGNSTALNFNAVVETAPGVQTLVEVGYSLNIKNKQLERRIDTQDIPNASVESGGISTVLAENVTKIAFQFYYRTGDNSFTFASQGWDSRRSRFRPLSFTGIAKNPDGLPDGVEITLTVHDGQGVYPDRSFTTMVYLMQDKYFNPEVAQP
jgi:hypothetical protein